MVDLEKKREYQREYYQRNKEKYAARGKALRDSITDEERKSNNEYRRMQYRFDPEYRSKCQESARKSQQKRKQKKMQEKISQLVDDLKNSSAFREVILGITNESVFVKWARLHDRDDRELPKYATVDSSGMDVMAWLPSGQEVKVYMNGSTHECSYYSIKDSISLNPFDRALIPTGLAIQIPKGYEGQLRPRSGNAIRLGLTFPNCTGTIDADYRGEIMVEVVNISKEPMKIDHKMRIAQLVISKYVKPINVLAYKLDNTDRGEGGIGSTDKKGGVA